jgi:V8-like Glu-specific endopeptidase
MMGSNDRSLSPAAGATPDTPSASTGSVPTDRRSASPEPGPGPVDQPTAGVEALAIQTESLGSRPGFVGERATASSDAGLDIASLSYGPSPRLGDGSMIGLESVIGDDERIPVPETDRYPWRAHASLLITAADGSRWIGTAFFISPRVLATAGHNLFIHGNDDARRGWVSSIEVIPGRDGDRRPFDSAITSQYYSVEGWTGVPHGQRPDPDYDYGAIVLGEDAVLGARTGWLGVAALDDKHLDRASLNLAGYPGDLGGSTQWYMARRTGDLETRRIYYDIDTYAGQSGSAVYVAAGDERYAVGIHAYGASGGSMNSATRITTEVYDNFARWVAMHQP